MLFILRISTGESGLPGQLKNKSTVGKENKVVVCMIISIHKEAIPQHQQCHELLQAPGPRLPSALHLLKHQESFLGASGLLVPIVDI